MQRSPDERTAARMGGLGFDTPELELIVRAKAALNAAGVDPETYQGLAPACRPGGVGSACELHFREPDELALARSLLRVAMHKVEDGAQTAVWLDVQKTREELKPARRVKSLHQSIKDALFDQEKQQVPCTFDQRTRSVSVRGARAAYMKGEEVKWTAVGVACLPEESREWIATVVEATR